jgi:hypothetical protein
MASLPDQCLPPAGTPAGTVCVLERGKEERWTWNRFKEWWRPYSAMTPERAASLGWRFVRVAGGADG